MEWSQPSVSLIGGAYFTLQTYHFCARPCHQALLCTQVSPVAVCWAFLLLPAVQAPGGAGAMVDFTCFAATPAYPSTCEYAYSLASVSIFFCFILSLMQCLTMDCCGMGRAVEAGFDAAACIWWIAGGITLGIRATEANSAGLPLASARNAVVALCWISALMFLALLITNMVSGAFNVCDMRTICSVLCQSVAGICGYVDVVHLHTYKMCVWCVCDIQKAQSFVCPCHITTGAECCCCSRQERKVHSPGWAALIQSAA